MLAVGEHVLDHLDPQCLRMATPLAGGVSATRLEMCGALSGGVMVIGALLGRTSPQESDERAYAVAQAYRERFLDELQDTQCAPLREQVQAPGGMGSCALLVERAAMILLQVLDEAGIPV